MKRRKKSQNTLSYNNRIKIILNIYNTDNNMIWSTSYNTDNCLFIGKIQLECFQNTHLLEKCFEFDPFIIKLVLNMIQVFLNYPTTTTISEVFFFQFRSKKFFFSIRKRNWNVKHSFYTFRNRFYQSNSVKLLNTIEQINRVIPQTHFEKSVNTIKFTVLNLRNKLKLSQNSQLSKDKDKMISSKFFTPTLENTVWSIQSAP